MTSALPKAEPAAVDIHPAFIYERISKKLQYPHQIPKHCWSVTCHKTLSPLLCRLHQPFAVWTTEKSNYYNSQLELSRIELLVDGQSVGPLNKLDFDKLCKVALPSPFGKGDQTMYDDKVRRALEISAHRISFCHTGKEEIVDIAEKILKDAHALAPVGHHFRPVLYKLCIYETGGHFDTHVDTLHDKKHMASAVVGLPSVFTGGVLKICGQPQSSDSTLSVPELSCDFAKACQPTDKMNILPNAIFYTDCEHEVTPVTSGLRVTLQYDLYVEKGISNTEGKPEDLNDESSDSGNQSNNSDVEPKDSSNFRNVRVMDYTGEIGMKIAQKAKAKYHSKNQVVLSAIVDACKSYFQSGPDIQPLAFLLRHRYHSASVTTELLKKSDESLVHALMNDFNISLTPLLMSALSDFDGEWQKDIQVRPFPTSSDSELDSDSNKSETDSEKLEFQEGNESLGAVTLVMGNQNFLRKIIKSVEYAEYTGNEAAVGECHYYSAAVVIHGIKQKQE